jgi:hypothetical protein
MDDLAINWLSSDTVVKVPGGTLSKKGTTASENQVQTSDMPRGVASVHSTDHQASKPAACPHVSVFDDVQVLARMTMAWSISSPQISLVSGSCLIVVT